MQSADAIGRLVVVVSADEGRHIAYALPGGLYTWFVRNGGYSFIVDTPAGAFVGDGSIGIDPHHAAMVGAPVASDAPVQASVQYLVNGAFQPFPQPVQSFAVLWGAQDAARMAIPSAYDSRYLFNLATNAGDAAAQFVAAYGTPSDSQARTNYVLV